MSLLTPHLRSEPTLYLLGDQKAPGSIPFMPLWCCCFLEQASTQLLVGTWWPGVIWESSPPSCNINRCLLLTGEANAQLSLSRLAVMRSLWNFGFRNLSP